MAQPLTGKTTGHIGPAAVLTIAAAAALMCIRKPDALLNPQFWAEDGVVFFGQQFELGAAAVFQPFAGYQHFVPRLIALVAEAFFPYAAIPAVYNISSLIITLAVIAGVFSPRLAVGHKPLLALALVLTPHYKNEVFLNITNLQWILAIALIVLLVKRPPSIDYGKVALQYAADAAVIVLCGLTGPFSVLLLPFFFLKWLKARTRHAAVVFLLMLVVSGIQLFFITADASAPQPFGLDAKTASAFFGSKLFGNLFLGYTLPYGLNPNVLCGIYGAVIAMLLYQAHRKTTAIAVLIAIQWVIAAATLFKFRSYPEILVPAANGGRYFYIPYIMLIWSLVALLDRRLKLQTAAAAAALVLILFSSLTSEFQSPPLVNYHWQAFTHRIGKENVTIPINPPGWRVALSARRSSE